MDPRTALFRLLVGVPGAGTWRALHGSVLRRFLLPFLVAFVCVSAIAAAADALVVTETERLEALADDLSDEDPGRRVDQLLRHVVPGREAVDLSVAGRRGRYAEGDEVDLADALRSSLRFLEARDVSTVQQSVSHRGDDATVALRVRAGGELHDVALDLRRHDDRWLVRRVVVR